MKLLYTGLLVTFIIIIGYVSNYYLYNNRKVMVVNDREMGGQGAFLNPGIKTEYFIGLPYVIVENTVFRSDGSVKILTGKSEIWFFKWKLYKIKRALYTPTL